jgi:cyclopropane-fatty-acyl-phospholipid synthase
MRIGRGAARVATGPQVPARIQRDTSQTGDRGQMSMRDDGRQLTAARKLAAEIGAHLDVDASVQLWDGSRVPLGRSVTSPLTIGITRPGVVPSIVRWPTLDRMIRHYAAGDITLDGGTLVDLGERLGQPEIRRRLRTLPKARLVRLLAPFYFAKAEPPLRSRDFSGDSAGERRVKAQNKDYIQFHYDVGNAFYRLFLDAQMVYSCAYFTGWGNTIDRAQADKLDMICRKLRLQPGDRFLDIGCGWGGLVCHAARHYGVTAHGITLSAEQLEFARERAAAAGLAHKITLEMRDYQDLQGQWDKIASIGMYEHIGLANIPTYFKTIRRILAPDGLFLNHAIARRASRSGRRFGTRAEHKAILKYIFPGGALDDIGHTLQEMERAGFAVHDVEGWREHYALTTRLWCERLTARREEAIALVGAETYRIWVAYLAGVSLAFSRGSLLLFQTLVARSPRGRSPLPPTRADLYRQ